MRRQLGEEAANRLPLPFYPGSHQRTYDLTPWAGDVLQTQRFGVTTTSGLGDADIWFADMVLVSSDGTVIPIYHRQDSIPLTPYETSSGMSNVSISADTTTVPASTNANIAATYYLGDQVGTTQMETAGNGVPVWQGEFSPFGQELDSQDTENNYKFTGKERDSESGLDYFGARYYSSVIGRFSSPDWSSKPQPVPYASLTNPQSLNLYSYVNNNPLSQVDADGHFASPWHFLLTFVAAIATGHDPVHAAIWGVKNAGVDFRHGSQSGDPADTHIHAMGAAGESTAQAYAGTAQTLSSEEASGDVGGAQHTIQDSYASGHDYSEWAPQNGPFGGLGFWGTAKHELGDWLPSPGALWGALQGSMDELRDPGVSPGSTLHPAPNLSPAPGGTNGMPQCIGCFVPPGYTPKPPPPPPIDPETFHTVAQ